MHDGFRVSSLHLTNVKCFADTTIPFTREDGAPAPWVTLLGENATGKTTILQSIALLIAGIENAPTLLPRPVSWLRDESRFGELAVNSIRNNSEEISQSCKVTGGEALESTIARKPDGSMEWYSAPAFVEPMLQLPMLDTWKIDPTRPEYDPSYQPPRWEIRPGFPFQFAAAYGPFRRLSRKESLPNAAPSKPERYTNFLSLFGEDEGLPVFEQWVWYLDNQAAKGDKAARRRLDAALAAVAELLPDGVDFDREALDKRSEVRFRVQGVSVPTHALSDGYRSVLALGGDLIWRILNAYPESDNPLEETGVVLIDEIDIHLHPRWQAWIAQRLRKLFPNLQFVVATHSPLVAIGAGEDALTLKLELVDGETEVRRLPDLSAMDVNRVLETAFGLVSPFSPEVQAKIDAYDRLIGKRERSAAEEAELGALRAFLAETRPFGGRPEPGSLDARIEAFLQANLPR